MDTQKNRRFLSFKGYRKLTSSNFASSQHENNIFRRVIEAIAHRKKSHSKKVQEAHVASHDELENKQTTVRQKFQKLQNDQNQNRSLNHQSSTWLRIYIKIASNSKTTVVQARGYCIVRDIKYKILDTEGLNPNEYSLFHGGKRLEDYRTLISLGIKTESTLHLIFNPKDLVSIFIRTPGGKFLKIEVNLLYTILDMKTIVESIIGCSVQDCKAIFAGKELENSKSLAFYGVGGESILELQPCWIQIFVKTWSGRTVTLYVRHSDTAREVKEKLFCKVGVPIYWQSIVFTGKTLDENRNLFSYNVCMHSTLHMILRLNKN